MVQCASTSRRFAAHPSRGADGVAAPRRRETTEETLMIVRRILVAWTAAAAALALPAAAQDYPVKPITLIVPWTAGGSTDITMRAIAEAASKHLGQPIVVDKDRKSVV